MRQMTIRSAVALLVTTAVLAAMPLMVSAAEVADGGEHAEGAPLGLKTDLAIWSLVVFLVFLFVLKKFAWGPLIAGLDQREAGIRANIEAAEDARRKAEKLLADHDAKLEGVQDEVREIIAEARRDAEHTRSEIMATTQADAEVTRQRAVDEIERARDLALKELFDTVANQVAAATEHVLERSLDDADQQRLIAEALAQVTGEAD